MTDAELKRLFLGSRQERSFLRPLAIRSRTFSVDGVCRNLQSPAKIAV
jgi:hypothetical protein